MTKKLLKSPHPGEILKIEFLDEFEITQSALAKDIGVSPSTINGIIKGKRIAADIDLRLCKFFGLSEGYFLRLQMAYDILEAKREREFADTMKKIKPYAIKTQQSASSKIGKKA